MNNSTVLKLYRKTLYTLMEVFEGDFTNFHRIRITIRREIEKNENEKDEKEIRKKILELEEARKIISTTLIQGKLQDNEFYRYKARPDLFMGFNTPTKNDIGEIKISEDELNKIKDNIKF